MGQKVTIGGDRIGAGHKMQTELHNYGMSSHNLSTIFRTTMGVGILYPSLVLLGERDDHFKINLEQDIRTQPTIAPLFGSFKLQTDVFMCPIRLYQGLLHNNPTELGKNMSQVKLPKIQIGTMIGSGHDGGFSNSCLMKYLGASGIGRILNNIGFIRRDFNAVPMLAYYDIFKNYYSNKQEENAYAISTLNYSNPFYLPTTEWCFEDGQYEYTIRENERKDYFYPDLAETALSGDQYHIKMDISEFANELNNETLSQNDIVKNIFISFRCGNNYMEYQKKSVKDWDNINVVTYTFSADNKTIILDINADTLAEVYPGQALGSDAPCYIETTSINLAGTDYMQLTAFPLKNIDKMRYDILKENELGVSFKITPTNSYMPYSLNCNTDGGGHTLNKLPLNGLMVKTYQNDLFNNWINSEWIDGENGVAELSKIIVEDGAIKIDALQFAKKVYNLYNRVAISGATYYEWQNVVWSESKQSHVESPVYVGGYASEVMFEEIVQTSPTELDGQYSALGTLGGKGKLVGKKGGYIEVDCDEACFIIAITSLTPRVSYTQGNEFYMTELDSIDDLHKPEFDGIGFQDLLGERLAWFDTRLNSGGTIMERSKIGKVPAWIEYQTNIDRTYGDFADEDKAGYMVLTRKYEQAEDGTIKDVTTYIDPSQYNYAFAVTEIDAQNFWLQANYDILARRRMSAHLIPQA